ncbi:FliA/WhiG family RNA polymerase sigma factor [Eubacteriales bacterium OttesenSCG-928-N14]|nr:FliA/WhiG family RNA polymerase sigma factor [Eubacteriales bacterium OttesenSCG-928-N14]
MANETSKKGESVQPSQMDVGQLWQAYQANPDNNLEYKNELVLRYMHLVRSIVYRMLPTYEGYSNYDDLLSCGVLGLMDAISKYDAKREVKFEYYASMRIKGEIIDHIRKQDWAPSSLRRKIKQISDAYSALENQLERTPTDYELAEHLGMDDDELQRIMEKTHMFNVVHFESMLSDNYPLSNAIQDKDELPDERVENKELVSILGQMIDELPEKERLVVSLYYFEEMTLKEIAEVMGVSESRISQIHSKVILKLRNKMQPIMER